MKILTSFGFIFNFHFMFTIFDVILIVLLAGFVFSGLFFGLIQTLGGLIGVIAGAYLAGHYFLSLAAWISGVTGIYNNIVKVVTFLLLFILINRIIGLLFYLLDKAFHLIAIIPFLKSINKLAGAIFGLLEGSLVLGLSLYILSKYQIGLWFTNALQSSKIAPKLIYIAKILLPLIPEVIKTLKGLI